MMAARAERAQTIDDVGGPVGDAAVRGVRQHPHEPVFRDGARCPAAGALATFDKSIPLAAVRGATRAHLLVIRPDLDGA